MRLAEHFLGQKRLIQLDCILCTLPLLSRGSGVRIPPGSPYQIKLRKPLSELLYLYAFFKIGLQIGLFVFANNYNVIKLRSLGQKRPPLIYYGKRRTFNFDI